MTLEPLEEGPEVIAHEATAFRVFTGLLDQ